MKTKKIVLIALIVFAAIALAITLRSKAAKAFFMSAFNKSGIVGQVNANGKLDGEVDIYKLGKLSEKDNFKNGLRNGLAIYYYESGAIRSRVLYRNGRIDSVSTNYYESGKVKSSESFKDGKFEGPKTLYYQNGQVEQKSFRSDNKVEGTEYAYYENGNLKYKRNWVNNKLYGDFYYYNKNKELETYHAYDILGDKFYLCRYDQTGKVSRSDGGVFSSRLYSKSIDSTLVLKNGYFYSFIKDLYITVANPPQSTTEVQVKINGKISQELTFPDPNTVAVKNAFIRPGSYKIIIDGIFLGKSGVIDHTVGELSIGLK